jgi:hypothetical protein
MRLIFNCSCGFLSDQQMVANAIIQFLDRYFCYGLHCVTIVYVTLLEINKLMHSSNLLNVIKPNQRISDLYHICNVSHLMSLNATCNIFMIQQWALGLGRIKTISRYFCHKLHYITIVYVSLIEIKKPMHSYNLLNAMKPNQRISDLCYICNFSHLMSFNATNNIFMI